MAAHEILGGLVQVYKRGGKALCEITPGKVQEYRGPSYDAAAQNNGGGRDPAAFEGWTKGSRPTALEGTFTEPVARRGRHAAARAQNRDPSPMACPVHGIEDY